MLTADLVRARMRKGVITPRFIGTGDEDALALARTLIEIFERSKGRPARLLDAELRDFLGTGTEFLLHRGLAKLLRDRCEFEMRCALPPEELRREVFTRAAAAYASEDRIRFGREAVVAEVCAEHGVDPSDFDRSLYADLKDEQVLVSFDRCEPEWLLARYDVALVQALLLRASRLEATLRDPRPERHRAVFRALKFHRLMHTITPLRRSSTEADEGAGRGGDDGRGGGDEAGGGFRIRIDGPLSLFRSSQKYGLQMAVFFPTLLHLRDFELEAAVPYGPKRRDAKLCLDASQRLRPPRPLTGQWRPEEVDWLRERFAKLDSDWELDPDPDVVDLGGQGVLVADYAFTHRPSGLRVWLEVLGYWRKSSLASRLEVLREHGPPNLIVAVSKELHADDGTFDDLPGETLLFRNSPIAKDVLATLERIRERA